MMMVSLVYTYVKTYRVVQSLSLVTWTSKSAGPMTVPLLLTNSGKGVLFLLSGKIGNWEGGLWKHSRNEAHPRGPMAELRTGVVIITHTNGTRTIGHFSPNCVYIIVSCFRRLQSSRVIKLSSNREKKKKKKNPMATVTTNRLLLTNICSSVKLNRLFFLLLERCLRSRRSYFGGGLSRCWSATRRRCTAF